MQSGALHSAVALSDDPFQAFIQQQIEHQPVNPFECLKPMQPVLSREQKDVGVETEPVEKKDKRVNTD